MRLHQRAERNVGQARLGETDPAAAKRRVARGKGRGAQRPAVFEAVVEARNRAETPQDRVRDQGRNETELVRGVGKLFALAESYPDLKADTVFERLSKEITAIEEKIAFGRTFVNDVVNEHNTLIQSFPNLLFAGLLGFRPLPLWQG